MHMEAQPCATNKKGCNRISSLAKGLHDFRNYNRYLLGIEGHLCLTETGREEERKEGKREGEQLREGRLFIIRTVREIPSTDCQAT